MAASLTNLMGGVEDFDRLATRDSPLHRRDPRAKLMVTLLAVVLAVTFHKYDVLGLLPLLTLPFVWLMVSGTPFRFLLANLKMALPFVFFVAIFNPWFDRTPVAQIGSMVVTGGWLSFTAIMLRFAITMSLIVLLVASTGFNTMCAGLLKLGAPKILVVQLLLLYRYLFLLADEASRIRHAYALRSLSNKGVQFKVYGSMLGQLLLRVIARGQRVHEAMLCRGFSGDIPVRKAFAWTSADTVFVLGWSAFLMVVRLVPVAHVLGQWLVRI